MGDVAFQSAGCPWAHNRRAMHTHYEILNLTSSATPEEIRAAYKKLSKVTHPDAGGSAALFAQISAAHHVLSDPGRRSVYDFDLHHGTLRDRNQSPPQKPRSRTNDTSTSSDWTSRDWTSSTPKSWRDLTDAERERLKANAEVSKAAQIRAKKDLRAASRAKRIRAKKDLKVKSHQEWAAGRPARRIAVAYVLIVGAALLGRTSGLTPALFGIEEGQRVGFGFAWRGPLNIAGELIAFLSIGAFWVGLRLGKHWSARARRHFPTRERIIVVSAVLVFTFAFEFLLRPWWSYFALGSVIWLYRRHAAKLVDSYEGYVPGPNKLSTVWRHLFKVA